MELFDEWTDDGERFMVKNAIWNVRRRRIGQNINCCAAELTLL
jgi:hypothetical protein